MSIPNIPATEVFNTIEYKKFCDDIHEEPRYHRKQWEFYVIQKEILEHFHGNIEKKIGLGFAVGQEVLLPYFVKKGAAIIGTDLDPSSETSKGWIDSNQHLSNNVPLNNIVDEKTFNTHFHMDYVDMNNIPAKYLHNQHDFIWSSCALEHLGSTQKGLDFIINSLACLKPGGVAVHTTEFSMSSHTEHFEHAQSAIYSRYLILNLINDIRLLGYDVKPIQFQREHSPINNHVDKPPYTNGKSCENCSHIFRDVKNTHLNLLLHDNVVSTSLYLVITKPC